MECKKNFESFIINEAIHPVQYGMKDWKGGIIVFATTVNALKLSDNAFVNKIKQRVKSFLNSFYKDKIVSKIIDRFNASGKGDYIGAYSVGNAFKGKYVDDNGNHFSDKSYTIEINGLSSEGLLKLSQYICRVFKQETVLIKDFNKDKIFLADSHESSNMDYDDINTEVSESVVNETGMSIERLLGKHTSAGYVIVSACRHENSAEENKLAKGNLRRDIRDAGYSFKSVLGGYIENQDTDEQQEVTEQSFVVFNMDRHGKPMDFERLKEFALDMCKKYSQESVLVVEPDGTPKYLDANGNIDIEFSGNVTINRAIEKFFTRIGNSRFTFKESRLEPHHSVMDRHCRYSMGEIF